MAQQDAHNTSSGEDRKLPPDTVTDNLDGHDALLIATKTCSACHTAKQYLDRYGISYRIRYADEDHDLVERYHIHHVPVLILIGKNGGEERLDGVEDILLYAKRNGVHAPSTT